MSTPASAANQGYVIVVDDERSVREILADMVGCLGYETGSAADAEEALRLVEERRPRLVLSDIEMPGTSGIELLQALKQLDEDLDVIMVTGVVDATVAVNSIRQGAADYVTKPFNLEEVQIVIERTLEKRRLVNENRAHQTRLEELVELRTHELSEKHGEVERLYQELQDSYESTLQALVTALDFRDNETHGHSIRVVEYAVLVAEAMGVDDREMADIRHGAILHDVGKIGIPDSILRKPGKLSEEEWAEMHKHPEMGYRMLEHIPFLKPALDIVLCHQERFDGSGYPRRLKGGQIPLGARIFAVVDTFDAMTSDRPYRKALPISAAREEIDRCSGTQFDPEVARAFLRIDEDTWCEIRARVHDEVSALDSAERLA